MFAYAGKRAAEALLVLLGASILVFALIRMVPGDPAQFVLGTDATPEQLAAVREQMGLNGPLPAQYLSWLGNALQGDFGQSLSNGADVGTLIAQRLPATIELALVAMALVLIISIPLGILAGNRPGSLTDHAVGGFTSLLLAVPTFWISILFVLLFALTLQVLPTGGRPDLADGLIPHLKALAMPAIALALSEVPIIVRFLRGGILDVRAEDYVRTARAKGVPRAQVTRTHVLRNALIPVTTMGGLVLGGLLGGVVITETVFTWPGLGTLLLDSIESRDYTVVQAALLLVVAIYVVVNLLVDVLYGLIDPRIRFGANTGVTR